MQKELEKDAELHADKEVIIFMIEPRIRLQGIFFQVFVTAAYRKKMEENEKFNAEQKRKDQIEGTVFM